MEFLCQSKELPGTVLFNGYANDHSRRVVAGDYSTGLQRLGAADKTSHEVGTLLANTTHGHRQHDDQRQSGPHLHLL